MGAQIRRPIECESRQPSTSMSVCDSHMRTFVEHCINTSALSGPFESVWPSAAENHSSPARFSSGTRDMGECLCQSSKLLSHHTPQQRNAVRKYHCRRCRIGVSQKIQGKLHMMRRPWHSVKISASGGVSAACNQSARKKTEHARDRVHLCAWLGQCSASLSPWTSADVCK